MGDILVRMRFDFEEHVHAKTEKVRVQVHKMKEAEQGDDVTQQLQINKIKVEIDRLKAALFKVQQVWDKMVGLYLHPVDGRFSDFDAETFISARHEKRKEHVESNTARRGNKMTDTALVGSPLPSRKNTYQEGD